MTKTLCKKDKICNRAKKAGIRFQGFSSRRKTWFEWTIDVYSKNGDNNPTKIEFCPFCGTKLDN